MITRACRLDWGAAFFADAEQRPVVLTAASAARADRQQASRVADVVVAGDTGVDLAHALAALGERGADNVLVEGGPSINGQLGELGLIDELCLTVSPVMVGGDAGRILAGPPTLPAAELELVHLLEADGFLFLRYRRR